ncbi:MAG: hypothetical protein ACREUT_15220 [Steroidobacteraceae bacterium]
MLGLIACAALGRIAAVDGALASAAAVPLVVAIVSALLFGMAAQRRQTRLTSARHRDWLAALPNDVSLTARAANVPAMVWAGIALAVVAAMAGAGLPASRIGTLLLASAAGCLIAAGTVAIFAFGGAAVASRSRRAVASSRYVSPPSRYAIVRRPRRAWATHPKLHPLGHWPLAQAKFFDRPTVRARSLVFLLMSLPLGITGPVALAAAAVWLITLHLVNLLLGIVRVAFVASWWLAPTPVGVVRFTAAAAHRVLLAEIAACALLVGMLYAIGGAPALERALPPAIAWIVVVCLLGAAACVLALRTSSVARSVLHRWMR